MRRHVPLIDGDEEDGLTTSKQWYHWRPGVRRALKRKYNRRERRALDRRMREEW